MIFGDKMIVGCPKEIKIGENRVALTPAGVSVLVEGGNDVLLEKGAGKNSGFSDEEYRAEGARIVDTPQEIFQRADMIIKVKEPVGGEPEMLRKGQILFTYLHLASMPELTEKLMKSGATGIAYETVELENGDLPLLTPMSEVAGRMAIQIGAHYLERTNGGSGRLLGGVPGAQPANVAIIGTGVVGINAAKMAVGMGANVTMIGRNAKQLREIDNLFHGRVRTLYSNSHYIAQAVKEADLAVGAVYITGAKAPHLVTRDMIRSMKAGSVIVDVAIDQGGIFETIRPTSHQNPVYVEEGVIHYGVTNMPGAVPHTSTIALTNATLPYAVEIAKYGVPEVFRRSVPLLKGLNIWQGKLTNKEVGEAVHIPWEKQEIALRA